MIFMYFAGQGAVDGLAAYFLAIDSGPNDLYSTAFPLDAFQAVFGGIAAETIILFLDSSYSGAATTSSSAQKTPRSLTVDDVFLRRLTRSRGRVIMSAARPAEVAIEAPDLGHGLFTHFVVESLKGAADLNRGGIVSFQELYEYVEQNVTRKSRAIGGNQHPMLKGELEGVLPLIRVPRP